MLDTHPDKGLHIALRVLNPSRAFVLFWYVSPKERTEVLFYSGFMQKLGKFAQGLMTKNKTILVWKWEDAPEEYRALSKHGGDEDFVAYVPEGLKDETIGWLEPGSRFGICSITLHEVLGGKVYIGAHA